MSVKTRSEAHMYPMQVHPDADVGFQSDCCGASKIVQVDHLAYPDIIDRIFHFAPRSSLLVLRRVCVEWRAHADALLVDHLSLLRSHLTYGPVSHPERNIAAHSWDTTRSLHVQGAVPPRLPPQHWDGLTNTRILDISPDDLLEEWIALIAKFPNIRVVRDYQSSFKLDLLPLCEMYCAHAPPSPYLGLQLQNPQIHKNGMVLVSLRLAPPSALQFPVASQSSWRDDIELVILFQPPYRGVRSTGPPSGWRIRSLGPPSPVPYEQASLVVTAIGKALPVMCSPRRITLVNSFSWRLPGAGSGTWMKHLEVGLSVARHLPRDERERTVWLQYLRRSMRIGMESVPENDWVGNDTADERLDYIKFETLDDFKARVGEEKFELAFLF